MNTLNQIQRQVRRTNGLLFNSNQMAANLSAAKIATQEEVDIYIKTYNSFMSNLTSLNNMFKFADVEAKELMNTETYKKINAYSGCAPIITESWVINIKVPGLLVV